MKVCNKCREEKPAVDFCRRKDSPDGYDYRCRACEAKRRADYGSKNLERDRERSRLRSARLRLENPVLENEKLREWRLRNKEKSRKTTADRKLIFPEISRAHAAAWKLRRSGFHAHHWSYKDEHVLDVIYVTRTQHARLHRLMLYDQSIMQFRSKASGAVLTRRDHLDMLSASTARTSSSCE